MTSVFKACSALAAGLALGAASAAIAAASWTPFFMLDKGVVYIDRNSVEHRGDTVDLTAELWFEAPPSLRGQLENYVRSKLTLDCRARTFLIREQRFYGMDGQELGANLHPSQPREAARGSFESAVLTTYCAGGH